MKAMILAAGRGQRMRPLTDTTPKPLLRVGGQPLIEYHLQKLAANGVTEVVINHAWLGEKIVKQLGSGERWGVSIHYSAEPEGGLETAGGIINALPLLGEEPFWLINGDVWSTADFSQLPTALLENDMAHLLLTDNPSHNLSGDFAIEGNRLRHKQATLPSWTYSGIGLIRPQWFSRQRVEKVALRPWFEQGIANDTIAASQLVGRWTDVGTPERLRQLDEQLRG